MNASWPSRLWACACVALLVCAAVQLPSGSDGPDEQSSVRFQAVEVYVDSGDQPLAAYQLDFIAIAGDVKIVGIEGGEHPAFAAAPYYDPAAMQSEHVIIAAFSTRVAESLPTGATRIATIHIMVSGPIEPQFNATLSAVATTGGAAIDSQIILQSGPNP